MAKQYKIKHHYSSRGDSNHSYKAAPHPLTILLIILLIAGLIFVGISIYQPVYDFIMSLGEQRVYNIDEPSLSEPEAPSSSQAVEQSSSQSQPEEIKAPQQARAVYMPAATFADALKHDEFIKTLPDGTTAVMLDIKDSDGYILYASQNAQAIKWGTVKENAPALEEFAKKLSAAGCKLVVRLTAFNDPLAARADRIKNPIHYQKQETLWLDNTAAAGGRPWLDPYSAQVREYLAGIAAEAASFGADLVILENVYFPFDAMNVATYQNTAGEARGTILKKFAAEVTAAVEAEGARAAIYLPSGAILMPDDIPEYRYGGNALNIPGDIVAIGSTGAITEDMLKDLREKTDGKTIIPIVRSEAELDIAKKLGFEEYVLVS